MVIKGATLPRIPLAICHHGAAIMVGQALVSTLRTIYKTSAKFPPNGGKCIEAIGDRETVLGKNGIGILVGSQFVSCS